MPEPGPYNVETYHRDLVLWELQGAGYPLRLLRLDPGSRVDDDLHAQVVSVGNHRAGTGFDKPW